MHVCVCVVGERGVLAFEQCILSLEKKREPVFKTLCERKTQDLSWGEMEMFREYVLTWRKSGG